MWSSEPGAQAWHKQHRRLHAYVCRDLPRRAHICARLRRPGSSIQQSPALAVANDHSLPEEPPNPSTRRHLSSQNHPITMLKRQRSSPSFVPDTPYAATPEPAIDAFERVAKRRRQIAPLRARAATHGNSSWGRDDTDGEEDVEGDEHPADQAESSEQAQRMEQAGEYRNVNTLLHDLHAEQRHRILFTSTSPDFHLSSPHQHIHPEHPYRHHFAAPDKTAPALSHDDSQISAHHDIHKHTPSFTISIPTKDADVVDHVEVQRVTQRYEDANRYVCSIHDNASRVDNLHYDRLLGSVFLHRRRQFDNPNFPDQT